MTTFDEEAQIIDLQPNAEPLRPPPSFATRVLHAGRSVLDGAHSVAVPIYQTASFQLADVGEATDGYSYARSSNPTRTALEECLAAMDDAKHCRSFSSGSATTDAVIRACCRVGDHVILPDDMFSATFRLIEQITSRMGIEFTVVDQSDLDATFAAMRPNTKLLYIESPSNPLLNVVDIPALAQIAHDSGAVVVLDNSLASPYLQRGLTLGADICIYTTKAAAGHSDVINGAAVTNDDALDEAIRTMQTTGGAIPGPFDAFLTLRGSKTLALRMEQHCNNAEAIAGALLGHPAVAEVIYPGLPDHPDHKLASSQMYRFGGVVGMRLKGGRQAAMDLCNRTELFLLAESFGGVESLIHMPTETVRVYVSDLAKRIPQDFVRLSVGIEDAADLIADLEQALG